MSDVVADHLEVVRRFSKPGGPLSVDAPTASVRNPAWFAEVPGNRAAPMPDRVALHRRLIDAERQRSPDAEPGRRALVLAGPPGAGKSTVRPQVLVDPSGYLVIDADEFKRALLREAIDDGSYDAWLKPTEVSDLETAGERFFPLELAALVHEESSQLAKQLRDEAMAEGLNVVIDTVLSSEAVALQLGEQLRAHGYDVRVVDVEVPFEISETRIRSRWVEAYTEALETGQDLGGRWVPSEYARDVFDGPDGSSKSEAAARRLAHECDAVTRYQLFRTTLAQTVSDDRPTPTLEVDLIRETPGGALVETRPGTTPAADRAAQVRAAVSRPIGDVAKQATTDPRSPAPGPGKNPKPDSPGRDLNR